MTCADTIARRAIVTYVTKSFHFQEKRSKRMGGRERRANPEMPLIRRISRRLRARVTFSNSNSRLIPFDVVGIA